MFISCCEIALFLAVILAQSSGSLDNPLEKGPSPSPYQDWDYLLFSQHWPITVCAEWEERSKDNTCSLPTNPTLWTVHGIWPTKIGTTGPYFCDSALHFDMDQLQPILGDLEIYWLNIENNTKLNSLWKHEWAKHGTCASVLPQLNSVYNYFERGLIWAKQYSINQMLNSANIVPNSNGYKVEDIFNGVKKFLGKNPTIQCVVDAKTKQSFMSEIRLCFDKNLDPIDCNVNKPYVSLYNDRDNILSNCNLNKPVMYYPTVPGGILGDQDQDYVPVEPCVDTSVVQFQRLLSLYNWIRFLIHFSL